MGVGFPVGIVSVSDLRSHLTAMLERKVASHGLVIWDDPDCEYGREVAATVVPATASFVPYEGTWFGLRRAVEDQVGGVMPPRAVLYVPARPPRNDPLLELRSAGTVVRIRLRTLLQQALKGELTEARIDELGKKIQSLSEAEAALKGGGTADPRLVALTGTSDVRRIIRAALAGEHVEVISGAHAWDAIGSLLSRTVGFEPSSHDATMAGGAMRHLVLAELRHTVGDVPNDLAVGWTPPTAEQARSATEVLEAWRGDRDGVATYVSRACAVDRDLALEDALSWHESLADLDSVPALEKIALREALRRITKRDYAGASELARRRLARSLWAGPHPPSDDLPEWAPRWEVLAAVAELRMALASSSVPTGAPQAFFGWYLDGGWAVDRAHRALETKASTLALEGDLEGEIAEARAAYEDWLGQVLIRFIRSVAEHGLEPGDVRLQGQIHKAWVSGSKTETAYIWVDALRYEMGRDLAERLERSGAKVQSDAAIAALPSITPVGMANLCPGAESGIAVALKGGRIAVKVGDVEVRDVPARIGLVRSADGRVEDLTLPKLLAQGEKRLTDALKGACVVMVRSQEIDASGESGMLATSWQGFDDTIQQLERAAARLVTAGVRRLVITADHGYVALSRPLGPDRRVEPPKGGKGELHARAWVGVGGVDSPDTARVSLASAGMQSDLDLVCPANLAVFRGSWSGQFFHGGISPQELVVPVVVAELPAVAEPDKVTLDITVASSRITSGVFSAVIATPIQRRLFETPAARIIVRRRGEGAAVAKIFRGDGYDAEADVVRLPEGMASVAFRVVANLNRNDEVEIVALDAASDRKLGSTIVRVAAPLMVEDDFS